MKNFNYLSLTGQQLLTFVTLHEVGTVTAVADKLDTTQSAVSHSLQKMREIFQDELFVRAGRSVTPTIKSQQLYPEIKAMLERLEDLTHTSHFEPATAEIDYVISSNDFQRDLIFPSLYKHLSPQLKKLSLEIYPSNQPNSELLRSQQVDLVISPIAPDYSDIMAVRLFDDVSECFYDANQREAPTSLADLRQANYVGVTFTKGLSLNKNTSKIMQTVDENTLIRVDSFAAVPQFVLDTELLVIAPSKLKQVTFKQLSSVPLPYQAPKMTLYMLWHKRYHKDAQHKWFREQIRSLYK